MWDICPFFLQHSSRRVGWQTAWRVVFVVALLGVVSSAALANDLFENRAWQFESATDRAHKAAVLDFILKQKAGGYTTYNTNNNTNLINYNISGDYIDCNMTSQALGNQGSVAQDAPVGSPSIGVDSSTSSSATGNSGTGTVTAGGNTADTGPTAQSSGTGMLDTSAAADGTNSVSNSQSNDGGAQSSSATGNSFDSTVSEVSGNGGEASVALNSSQTMDNTSVSSAISNSDVCRFNTVSDNIGYPLNSGGN